MFLDYGSGLLGLIILRPPAGVKPLETGGVALLYCGVFKQGESIMGIRHLTAIVLLVSGFASGQNRVEEHFVPVRSIAPSMPGEMAQLYVREHQPGAGLPANPEGRVVLFVHGNGTPAEVAFDVPAAGYSWMASLAAAGFDTFAMDQTGYGRSTRPYPLNDRCNLAPADQEAVFGDRCEPSFGQASTTLESDWHDIDAVVDYLRELRGVEKVHLVAWSLGGPRAAGYAATHPDKVANMVLLAPAYFADVAATLAETEVAGAAMSKQTRQDFIANWDRQVGCTNQYDPAVASVIFDDMLASDPVGRTWGPGLRRAPRVANYGWTPALVAGTRHPVLAVTGLQDKQVLPERVRDYFATAGAANKVLVEFACGSHNVMWERNVATQLFGMTAQWLSDTRVEGLENGRISVLENGTMVKE
jgi:pimeloyl-ACP methyl ester carboxylesterase